MSVQTNSPEIWEDDADWQDDDESREDNVVQMMVFGPARRSIEQLEEERLLKRALVDPFDELDD